MNKVSNYVPASNELEKFIYTVCPTNAHMELVVHGTWADGDWESFAGQYMSQDTTACNVVRSFSCKGATYWTLEQWEHDNGYRCTLTVLDKQAFLTLIRS